MARFLFGYILKHMKKDDQNFWNAVFSVFFIAVAVMMIKSLYNTNGHLPTSIPLFDLFLIILATFRLTRLFVYDKITHFVRDMFLHVEETYTQEGVTYFTKVERTNGPLRTAYCVLRMNCLSALGALVYGPRFLLSMLILNVLHCFGYRYLF